MTESTDAEEFLRDWREKILSRLGNGSLKKWRSYSEFGQIEIEYLEFVLDILYCNSKFNSVIFELDVFRFTVKGAYEDREELMLMRYKTLYGGSG